MQKQIKKTCTLCKTQYLASSHANNSKYCNACKVIQYKKHNEFTEYKRQQQLERNNRQASKPSKNKIQCLECGKYYAKPASHAFQQHQMTAREYKQKHGLEVSKGIITNEMKDKLKQYTYENRTKVIDNNLIKAGKQTRYKTAPNWNYNYKRSPQTLERLSKLHLIKKTICKKEK